MPVYATTTLIYAGAALAEIAGCFAFWAWLRQGHSPLWLVPGIASLVVFAWLLTLAPAAHAGRPTQPMAASTSWRHCSGCGWPNPTRPIVGI